MCILNITSITLFNFKRCFYFSINIDFLFFSLSNTCYTKSLFIQQTFNLEINFALTKMFLFCNCSHFVIQTFLVVDHHRTLKTLTLFFEICILCLHLGNLILHPMNYFSHFGTFSNFKICIYFHRMNSFSLII